MSARTQARVAPYLKVAAPAALVAMVPPTVAASYVGIGGYHCPRVASTGVRSASTTPGSTATMPRATGPMVVSRAVDSTISPRGVAPLVRDDCAPTTRTGVGPRRRAATAASVAGKQTSDAVPPGLRAASVR